MSTYRSKVCNTSKRECASCKIGLYSGFRRQNSENTNKLKSHSISPTLKYDIYKKHGVFIQDHQNLCSNCMKTSIDYLNFDYNTENHVLPKYIILVLEQVCKQHTAINIRKDKAYIYHDEVILNDDHQILTGLTIENKRVLEARIYNDNNDNNSQDNNNNINPQHLILFLTLIYQGLSEAFAGVLFGYAKSSVSRIIRNVANILSRSYVPTELGSTAWDNDEVLDNIPPYVETLFPNKNVVAIADGGYIQIGKTSDFQIQKKTYCSHKFFNCYKPMIVSTLNGKIINAYGPFFSDGYNTDSKIWDKIVKNDNNQFDLNEILNIETNCVIVDRGFRYCKTNGFENDGYELILPSCLQPNQKQLTKEEANHSRKVTKVRWPVECLMHHIKLWKFFQSKVNLLYGSDLIWNIFTIVCAMYNTFRAPIIKQTSYSILTEDAKSIIKMLETSNENNIPSVEAAQKNGWYKDTILSLKGMYFFPKYTIDDIRKWNCGPYQLMLAAKYLRHKIELKTYRHDTYPNTIKIKGMISRYSRYDKSKKLRTIYLRFVPGVDEGLDEGVFAYCTCYNGQRTVGGCAHIIAILYQILIILTNDDNNGDYYYTQNIVNNDNSTLKLLFENIIDCGNEIVDDISESDVSNENDSSEEDEKKDENDDKSEEDDEDNAEISDTTTNQKRKMNNQQKSSRKKHRHSPTLSQ